MVSGLETEGVFVAFDGGDTRDDVGGLERKVLDLLEKGLVLLVELFLLHLLSRDLLMLLPNVLFHLCDLTSCHLQRLCHLFDCRLYPINSSSVSSSTQNKKEKKKKDLFCFDETAELGGLAEEAFELVVLALEFAFKTEKVMDEADALSLDSTHLSEVKRIIFIIFVIFSFSFLTRRSTCLSWSDRKVTRLEVQKAARVLLERAVRGRR